MKELGPNDQAAPGSVAILSSVGTLQGRWPSAKRIYDVSLAGIGLLVLSPLLALVALCIKLADGGSVFYRQRRVGQYGVPFLIWKFRTMVPNAEKIGPPVTGDGDRRITRFGRFLRRSKLDELPQLWNVLRGEMSLVGPRPEVERYVQQYTPEQRPILQLKPGITDLASLRFRNEEALLQASENTENFYIQQCLPRKLELNQQYARRANLLTDTWVLLQTVCPYWIGVSGLYAVVLTVSFWFSYWLISDFSFSKLAWRQLLSQWPLVIPCQLACLLHRRQYKGLLCYFGIPELRQLGLGLIWAAVLLFAISATPFLISLPRNLIVMDLFLSLLFLSGFRLLLRRWRECFEVQDSPPAARPVRVGIIGAGTLGAQLAHSLNSERRLGRTAVAFFDDDAGKWQKHLHEVPIVGMPECLLQDWGEKLDEVAIALPDASAERLEELRQLFEARNLRAYTVNWPHASLSALETHPPQFKSEKV